jgi:uncharacterized tellurite resistance protein B-like protein
MAEHGHLPGELRLRICRLIAGIVIADDDLDPAEDLFIDRMLTAFGFTTNDRSHIFPIVDSHEAAAAMRELPGATQDLAFDLLLDAAAADGRLVPEERTYLDEVARVVGIEAGDIDARMAARIGVKR